VTQARRTVGRVAEDATARWYEAEGYTVLARNWRVREGEIDLVLRRGRTVVFCEVKARGSDRFGTPFDAVTRTKQQRLRGLAAAYLRAEPQPGCTLRFDVAAVAPGGTAPKVQVLEAAF
jgi:putative endonuclease